MFEAIGFICLLAILGVLIGKIFNASKLGEAYDQAIIFVGLVVALFGWIFYYIILSGAIMQEQTITSSSETFVVASTQFYYLSMLMPVANFLIILVGMLTVIEVLLIFNQFSKRPKGLRGK